MLPISSSVADSELSRNGSLLRGLAAPSEKFAFASRNNSSPELDNKISPVPTLSFSLLPGSKEFGPDTTKPVKSHQISKPMFL